MVDNVNEEGLTPEVGCEGLLDDVGSNVEVVISFVDDKIEEVSMFSGVVISLVDEKNEEWLTPEVEFVVVDSLVDVVSNVEVDISLVDEKTEEILVVV